MASTILLTLTLGVLCGILLRVRKLTKRLHSVERDCTDLRRLLKKRGDLSSEVAHEIKNPLTAILCSAEALELILADKLEPAYRQTLHYIKEYGDNLLHLVSDFLDVSRAEAGVITAEIEPVDVGTIAKSVVGLLDTNALRKQLVTKVTTDGAWAYCDSKQLKQVIFNLVHNAIKFTPEEGVIEVAIFRRENDRTVIEVRDNGCGIPAEEVERVFDPYAQLDAGQHVGGAGLGLALCRSLVELSGGTITLESVYGLGSTFRIVFRSAPLLTTGPELEGLGTPLSGQTVLVIDQDQGTREAVSRLIEAWGAAVSQAGQAAEAVEALSAKRFDTVVIDASLDGGYGCELARFLKETVLSGETTVVVAKGASNGEVPLIGVDRVIEKPLTGRALLSSLLPGGTH